MRIEVLPILLTACCGPSAAFTFHRPSNLIYQRTEPIALFSTTETETFDREVVGSQEKDVSMWRKAYRKTIVRGYKSLFSKQRSKKELKIGIAGFYDRSSQLWEEVWGEHMHHGYYIPENRTDHQQAQVDLIDEVLQWAEVGLKPATLPTRVVDVGCGIGGSSRHISRKFGSTVKAITLSPYQTSRGNELNAEQGLSKKVNLQVADALEMPFEDNSFDLAWSLESGEHMPDKEKFVNELFRVVEPGGRIVVVTWVHRDLEEGEESLTRKEKRILSMINRAYYLPPWCSTNDYVKLFEKNGAENIKIEDWSYIIAPFWKAVIKSSLNVKSVWGLLKSGFSTQRGAYAMLLMLYGFQKGTIKFGLITATKKEEFKL